MSQINNRRVLKNTIFLYMRMLLGLVVTLITARVILEALGVVDYGLNDVVGGMVSLFAFVISTLSTSSSRFMAYSLGQGDTIELKKIFSNAFLIHLYICVIIITLGETVGLYLVDNILSIPETRLFACKVLWQTVIVGSCLSMLSVPMSALVISYEKMDMYAYIGMFDIIARLLIVYIVKVIPYDKLIALAFLNMAISFIDISIYFIYCKYKFDNVISFSIKRDKEIQKSMLGFTGWNIIGSLANMLRHTGLNMLLNVFFGPIANAANAIAFRVNNAIMGFTGNFTTAVNPQIIKSFAAEEFEGMKNLIYRSGKLTYYMLMLLCFPVIFECNYILHLWLGNTMPNDAIILTRLVLIISMVDTFTYSIGCAVQATGKVRNYQIVISGISLAIFPISWVLFEIGLPLYYGLIVYLCCSTIGLMVRMHFIKTLLNIKPSDYIRNVFVPTIFSTIISLPLPLLYSFYVQDGLPRCITLIVLVEICSMISIWFCGLTPSEKTFIKKSINSIKSKIIHK